MWLPPTTTTDWNKQSTTPVNLRGATSFPRKSYFLEECDDLLRSSSRGRRGRQWLVLNFRKRDANLLNFSPIFMNLITSLPRLTCILCRKEEKLWNGNYHMCIYEFMWIILGNQELARFKIDEDCTELNYSPDRDIKLDNLFGNEFNCAPRKCINWEIKVDEWNYCHTF